MNTRRSSLGIAALLILSAVAASAASALSEARQCATELPSTGEANSGRTVISNEPWTPAPGGEKVIYGTDDRKDVYQETNATIKAWAGSVCALISTSQLTANGSGGWHIATSAFRFQGQPPCATEPFASQPTAPFCTGFLVGPDIVATAGHCYDAADYASVRFVFNFEMVNATTPELDVTADQVYTGVALLGHRYDRVGEMQDFSIIQLDRAVTAPGAAPLPIRRTADDVPVGTLVGVIGYPAGLPKKIAFGSATHVTDNSATAYFVANLDTYGGNSGSPVFNAATGVVEGILVRGNDDFHSTGSCFVSNVLPNSTTNAEEVSKATTFEQYVPALGGTGVLTLDKSVYACGATMAITLTDTNASGSTQAVTATSGTGDTETVTLTQTAAGSHKFTGSLPLTTSAVAAQNGALSVGDGASVTVLYHDQVNSAGAGQDITATAQVDCAGPVVGSVVFTAISGASESVQFQTNETAGCTIAYSAAACHDAGALTVTTPAGTGHSSLLTGLTPNTTYYVFITATDTVGNSTVSDNGGACFTFTSGNLANPVVDGGFELGNPNPAWTQGSTNFGSVICSQACNSETTYTSFEGSWWAWFGGAKNTTEDGYIAQSVTLPAAASAVLTFELQIPASHVPGNLRVLMDSTQLFQVTQADAAAYAAYRAVVVPMSAYADGAPHILRFEGHTDATGIAEVTNFFVDNVSITLFSEGEPPIQVTVPGVEGLAQVSALSTLQSGGFNGQVTSQECSDVFAAGQVASQSPAAGSSVALGTTVSLIVSTGRCTPVEGETAEGEGEGEGEVEGEATYVAQQLYDAFALADTNGDGLLSITEAQTAQPELTTAEFMAIDYDGNGKLSQSELADYLGINTGCTCNKSDFTLGGLQKRIGDFFLAGLSLAVLTLLAARRMR